MREDVKNKILPPPLRGDVGVVTYIQTRLILRGDRSEVLRRLVKCAQTPNLGGEQCRLIK
jgi:hypothetical protein